MYAYATIKCKCGRIFVVQFQESSHDIPAVCPCCKLAMDIDSWHALRNLMGSLEEFNYHIHKYHTEREEPLMLVESISSFIKEKS